MVTISVAVSILAMSLLVDGQTLMSRVSMEGVTTTVTFRTSGNDIIGSFDQTDSKGISGDVNIRIHSAWVHYDVSDKCSSAQLGTQLDGMNASFSYPNEFTLSSTTLNDIEGRSLVLQIGGKPVCATIQQDGDYITAAAYVRDTIFGAIFFRQRSLSSNTLIVSNLNTYEGFTEGSWFIAKNAVDCENLGDPTKIERFNPANVDSQLCDQRYQSNCAIGNLIGKLGNVQVVANSDIKRTSYRDSNLPLSGAKSIAGKYLIIYDPNNLKKKACTKIFVFNLRSASSTFNHEGVTGRFIFRQASPFDSTIATVHLQGLNKGAKGYHVHKWPVPVQSVKGQALCAGNVVSGHLNPYAISVGNNYPEPKSTTDDLYESGDLSSKYGTLADLSEFGPTNFTDWNLSLFGRKSIVGRSIVIHRNDAGASRWMCSNIEFEGDVISASAVFTTPVIGQIFFTETLDIPETFIFVRLGYYDGRGQTNGHKWQVSKGLVGRGMSCQSAGQIFNPSDIWKDDNTYVAKCSSDTRVCKLGDLSGRHERIDIGGADAKAKVFFTDSSIRLSGSDSIIGRSVAIMDSSGSQIMSCADVKMLHNLKMSANLDSGNLKGKVQFSQRAGFGQIPTMVSLDTIEGFNMNSHRVEIRTHPVPSGDNPCSKLGGVFDPLQFTSNSGQTHDQYKVGDLSRRGSMSQWHDFNLPMKGPSSIRGHSLAVSSGNNVVACAPIEFDFDEITNGYLIVANLVFSGSVMGKIQLSQLYYDDESLSDTSIKVDLKNSDDSTTPDHNWHVHEFPTAIDATTDTGICSSPGSHYDPFMAKIGNASSAYSTQCGLLSPLRCEVGDQAMKLGTYTIGSGAHVFNDVYLHLVGEYSVQGRSIVVHTKNKGVPRLACADIIPSNGLEIEVQFTTPQRFTKRDAAKTFAAAIKAEKENLVVELLSQSDGKTKINVHFLGSHRNVLRSKFKKFISSESDRQTLGDYSTISVVSKANHIMSSILVILCSFILGNSLA